MKELFKRLFPSTMWTSTACFYAAVTFIKIMLFNIIWCYQTTFTAFSYPETYINTILATFILAAPYMLARSNRLQLLVLLLIDAALVCNLMYSRTYNSIIPLDSYALAGNLSDFMPSVVDSMRWIDLLFPLTTIGAMIYTASRGKEKHKRLRFNRVYGAWTLFFACISMLFVVTKGGLTKAFNNLQDANHYTCTVPMYTISGCLLNEALQSKEEFTPEMQKEIDDWFAQQPDFLPRTNCISQRTNVVVILCESLESWVLERKVEGKELTPHINQLLKEPTTLYAPHVLTQVKGGRSIDCQLLLNAGMLPIANGCYAVLYPNNNFYTLTKAVTKGNERNATLLTVDKEVTWNQGMVAKAFGIGTIFSKDSWVLDEKVGSRKKLGDVSFMKQSVEKIKKNVVRMSPNNNYLQFVTYSGHNPFKLPEALQQIQLKGDYPERMRDYMIMANYTDKAIGIIVDYLKSRPDYENTLVVITGDHEGLAADRASLCQSTAGKGVVSPQQFTPFIVLNSPKGMRYNEVMGQIDMYPTILSLLQVNNYAWKGMGQTIFDSRKAPIAISPNGEVVGNTKGVSAQEINRLKRAWHISDLMLRFNKMPSQKK